MTHHDQAAQATLRALREPTEGRIYDLDPGRFAGMPLYEGHPPWQLVGYRTPQGVRAQRDQAWLAPESNKANIGFMTELLIACMHSGAHIDALAHITCGPDSHWHGGHSADVALGDFGPLAEDASTIAPIVARGVLVDLASALGHERLPASRAVTLEEVRDALARQGTELRAGDVALFRTGQMAVWNDIEAWRQTAGAGITRSVADWLVEIGVRAVGGDTETVEVMPSIEPDNPHPVHMRLLIEEGIHLMECLYLEELAANRAYEFLFVALPPKITGATAALLRPIAIT